MDKLERYLDQVCHSVGGPRSLRRHVRQELREHLLDAAAQHRASGFSEDEALERALEEFGRPEEMKSELEATHGHRVMAVVIDKALEWKEKTMRAKWLWTTWATAAIVVVIALAVLFITATEMFIVPKFNQLLHEGLIDPAIIGEAGVSWMLSWLASFGRFAEQATWWVLLAVVAWGLFEWRVRNENKTFMRLSALGTVAVGLVVVVWFMGATLLVSFCLAAPASGRLAGEFAVTQIDAVNSAVDGVDDAVAQNDWPVIATDVQQALGAIDALLNEAAAIPALRSRDRDMDVDEFRTALTDARAALNDARQVVSIKDASRLKMAMNNFRKAYDPVRAAVKHSTK